MFDTSVAQELSGNPYLFSLIISYNKIKITKVEMLSFNKVMRFTFNNGKTIRTICNAKDIFSIETACYVALAKYLSRNTLTPEGISKMAEELKYYKDANKTVAAAIKLYNKSIKDAEKAKLAEEEAKAIKERHRKKKIAYKARRAAKKEKHLY